MGKEKGVTRVDDVAKKVRKPKEKGKTVKVHRRSGKSRTQTASFNSNLRIQEKRNPFPCPGGGGGKASEGGAEEGGGGRALAPRMGGSSLTDSVTQYRPCLKGGGKNDCLSPPLSLKKEEGSDGRARSNVSLFVGVESLGKSLGILRVLQGVQRREGRSG